MNQGALSDILFALGAMLMAWDFSIKLRSFFPTLGSKAVKKIIEQ